MPPLDRDQFPVTDRWAYFNHAGIGPLPHAAVEAMHRAALDAALDGEFSYEAHAAGIERARDSAARLMGVPAADVAFVKNTTEGLGLVANGLAWSPGDRVVIPDLEFPSTLYPWLALADRGVVVDRVRPRGPAGALPVGAFADVIAAGPPPKLVVTSWVQFSRGWRVDLAALGRVCRDAGALLCADVIQGLGVLPAALADWGVDFAMADGHKWLLGPNGCGVFYVRGSRRDLLRPLQPGWNSVRHRMEWDNLDFDLDDSARRFEGGTPNAAGILALGASLDLLLAAGPGALWEHALALTGRACDGLTRAGATVLSDRSPAGRSAIVTFTVPGHDPDTVVETLKGQGLVCSARGGGVRFAPHGYNTAGEIDRLTAAVAALIG